VTITYHREPWVTAWPEIEPILSGEHVTEAQNGSGLQFNLNKAAVDALAELDLVDCIMARDEGKLVGYHIALICPQMQFWSTPSAQVLTYYVDPTCRGRGIGQALLQCAEALYRQRGLVCVYSEYKMHIKGAAYMFAKEGWEATSVTVRKMLR
jgi:ribosomal protein S18 acetylase RimI-like enzyme